MINKLLNGSFCSLAFPPFICPRMYPFHHVLDLVPYHAFHCFTPFLRLDVFAVSWGFLRLLPKTDTHNLLLHRLLIFGCVHQFYLLEVEKLSIIAIANNANNINTLAFLDDSRETLWILVHSIIFNVFKRVSFS